MSVTKRKTSFSSQYIHRLSQVSTKTWLWVIILSATAIRIAAALYLGNQVIDMPGINDQLSYDALANSLIAGRGYQFDVAWYPFTKAGEPTAHWSFLYPLYLAGVYKVVSYQPIVARLIQAILAGIFMPLLTYRIARRLAGEAVGLWSAAICALYTFLIYYSAALMTESFFIITVLFAIDLAYQIAKGNRHLLTWIFLGLSLAIATLLRQVIILFIPFLFIWIFWAGKGKIKVWQFILPTAIIVLSIMPWTIRNYVVYNRFLLLNSNAGFAFFTSNHPRHGTNYDWRFLPKLSTKYMTMNEAQINDLLTARGIKFMLSDPLRTIKLSFSKIDDYFRFWPWSESSAISNLARVLSFGVFLPFMIYGLFLSFRKWRDYSLLYLFIFIYSGIHILSWPGPRYRLPVDALLIIFAGLALHDIYLRITRIIATRNPPIGSTSVL
jgi:4-amino-4-deoxy-L-arabinose transferase-like glycosyltransferase